MSRRRWIRLTITVAVIVVPATLAVAAGWIWACVLLTCGLATLAARAWARQKLPRRQRRKRVGSSTLGRGRRNRGKRKGVDVTLVSMVAPSTKPRWNQVHSENAGAGAVAIVPVAQLAAIEGIETRLKLTAKQSESLAHKAHEAGLVIEPDVRVSHRLYRWDEQVALYRPEGAPSLPADARYAGASLMLELGLFVAAADGQVDTQEVDHLAQFLESELPLETPDARRLEARKQLLLAQPASLAGLGKRVQAALTPAQRESVGQCLVGIASSSGQIDKRELAALRSAYRALGIDAAKLDVLLDDLGRTQPKVASTALGTQTERTLTLDDDKVRKILSETRDVAQMLGAAMSEPEPEVDAAPRPQAPISRVVDPRFDGLDTRYHGALAELVSRPAWSHSDFEALARRHALMPASTLDVINEWAQETLGDMMVEEQGDVLVVRTNLITVQS